MNEEASSCIIGSMNLRMNLNNDIYSVIKISVIKMVPHTTWLHPHKMTHMTHLPAGVDESRAVH